MIYRLPIPLGIVQGFFEIIDKAVFMALLQKGLSCPSLARGATGALPLAHEPFLEIDH